MTQAYCVRCRKMADIQNPQQVALKNGSPGNVSGDGHRGLTDGRAVDGP